MTRVWIGATVAFCLCVQSARGDQPGQGEKTIPAPPAATTSSPPPGTWGAGWTWSPGWTLTPSSLVPGTYTLQQVPTAVTGYGSAHAAETERRHIRSVLQLKAVPAVNLAKTINSVLGAEGQSPQSGAAPRVVIVADAVSNCLVVAGPAEAVEAVEKMVVKLDRAAAMVRLEIVVGDIPIGKAESGPVVETTPETIRQEIEVLIQAELTTLDNQPAKLHIGGRQPRITGTTTTREGQANTITMENVGTILSVTPRIGADGAVFLALNVEDSRLGSEEEGVPIAVRGEGKVVRSPRTKMFTMQSTIRAADGQTVVAGGMAREAKAGKQRVVLVTPHVLAAGGAHRGK